MLCASDIPEMLQLWLKGGVEATALGLRVAEGEEQLHDYRAAMHTCWTMHLCLTRHLAVQLDLQAHVRQCSENILLMQLCNDADAGCRWCAAGVDWHGSISAGAAWCSPCQHSVRG